MYLQGSSRKDLQTILSLWSRNRMKFLEFKAFTGLKEDMYPYL
ncbi:unnamed protein product [Larinioides sclopetarius]|uniref:Maturase K n=1 Tax=Larinioides sclopetarius TaxID=280406 RepID=A0AAV1ZXZ2_9ARAC